MPDAPGCVMARLTSVETGHASSPSLASSQVFRWLGPWHRPLLTTSAPLARPWQLLGIRIHRPLYWEGESLLGWAGHASTWPCFSLFHWQRHCLHRWFPAGMSLASTDTGSFYRWHALGIGSVFVAGTPLASFLTPLFIASSSSGSDPDRSSLSSSMLLARRGFGPTFVSDSSLYSAAAVFPHLCALWKFASLRSSSSHRSLCVTVHGAGARGHFLFLSFFGLPSVRAAPTASLL